MAQPNLAGLVCFAEFGQIMDILPDFFLDYRERLSTDTRWTDRVAAHDATWSGNIVDFFYRIYDKVTSGVKTPFALDERDRRIDETDIHEAVREVVANALIHADYHGRQGIVVEKKYNEVKVSNPGTMRISKEIAIEGGRSDPRNAQVFNIFSLIGIGERSGTGLSNPYALWGQHGFAAPVIREEFDPEKTIVNIATEPSQSISANTRTEPDHNPDTTRTELGNNLASTRTEPVQKPYRTRIIPDHGESVDAGIKSLLNSLNSSTRRVYHELTKDGTITMRGLATKLGVNKDTINIAVGTLVSKKLIRRVGPKKGGHWEVVK